VAQDHAARQRAYKASRRRPDENPDEIPVERLTGRGLTEIAHLQERLREASRGQVDVAADVAPIRVVLEQGCDLEADVLPIVARDVRGPSLSWPNMKP
jgi:hypothetical protein